MSFYFEQNFIEKFHRESVFIYVFAFFFFKLRSRDYFRETKIRFSLSFLNTTFIECYFCWLLVVLDVYRKGARFRPKLLR